MWQLAQAKAHEAPVLLFHSTALAWERRWTRMIGTACAVLFAESLVEPSESLNLVPHKRGRAVPGLCSVA